MYTLDTLNTHMMNTLYAFFITMHFIYSLNSLETEKTPFLELLKLFKNSFFVALMCALKVSTEYTLTHFH